MDKQLKVTIEAVMSVDGLGEELQDAIEKLREVGSADIVDIDVVTPQKKK